LAKPQVHKSARDRIRETITPPRVGLLSWAFAAVLMGTVGLASYQFGNRATGTASKTFSSQGQLLPPPGEVETTASIRYPRGGVPAEVMQVPRPGRDYSQTSDNKGQIEVLQREVVGLRRRLSALSEQNLTYSRRIAALEKEVALARLTGAVKPTTSGKPPENGHAEPAPGIVITKAAPGPAPRPKKVAAAPEKMTPPSASLPEPGEEPAPLRVIDMNRTRPLVKTMPERTVEIAEPVRIVNLPQASDPPTITGSIPPRSKAAPPEEFDTAPTRNTLKPKILAPSEPSGRLKGGSQSKLKRSDFGAVIGRYASEAEAVKAWADFKEQNQERMRDLRPLVLKRQVEQGGVSLLVGPFANAADAAVACLHLLDMTALCHPTLFAGTPLIAAADMPDTPF